MQTELFKNQVCQANQVSDQSQREKTVMHRIGQKRKSSSRRSYEELEELKKLCCTEAERAKIDEHSIQEKESQSTVNQLTVQIQELQDKVRTIPENSMILKRQAVQGYPTFPVSL